MLSNPACSDMLNSFQFGSAALYSYSNLALLPSSFVQECGVPRRLPPGTEARPQPRRLRPNLYPRVTGQSTSPTPVSLNDLPPGFVPQFFNCRGNLLPQSKLSSRSPSVARRLSEQSECAHLQTDLSGLRSLSIFPNE